MADKKDKELSEKDLKKASGGVDPRLQFKTGGVRGSGSPTDPGEPEPIDPLLGTKDKTRKGSQIRPM